MSHNNYCLFSQQMAESQEPDYIFKLLLIGDAGVGKSSIMRRFSEGTFAEGNFSTIGVDFRIKTMEVDDKVLKLQIWDTAGHERFRSVTYSYYRGAHGIILVYDITKKESFNNLPKWLEDIQKYSQSCVALMVVGNKCDIVDGRQVEKSAARIYSKENNMLFLETSAKNAENVHEAFRLLSTTIKNIVLAKMTAERIEYGKRSPTIKFNQTDEIKTKKSCCS